MRHLLSIVVILMASVVPTFSDEAREPLRFGWPSRCAANVELTSERSVGGASRSVVIRVRLDVSPHGQDGSLLLAFSNPTITAIDGVPFNKVPREKASVDVAQVMSRAIPSFVVGPSGNYVEVRDATRTVREVAQAAGLPADFPGLRVFRSLVEQVASSDWQAWVELWLGDQMAPGEWTRSERTMEFEGAVTPVTMTRRRLQPIEGPGRSRFQLELEYPSPAVRSYATGFLLDMARDAKALGDDVRANREWMKKAGFSPLTETITAELATTTLRPVVVERARAFFAVNGAHRVEGRERRTHRFTWIDEPVAAEP